MANSNPLRAIPMNNNYVNIGTIKKTEEPDDIEKVIEEIKHHKEFRPCEYGRFVAVYGLDRILKDWSERNGKQV